VWIKLLERKKQSQKLFCRNEEAIGRRMKYNIAKVYRQPVRANAKGGGSVIK
jgi:hypothetical protein